MFDSSEVDEGMGRRIVDKESFHNRATGTEQNFMSQYLCLIIADQSHIGKLTMCANFF